MVMVGTVYLNQDERTMVGKIKALTNSTDERLNDPQKATEDLAVLATCFSWYQKLDVPQWVLGFYTEDYLENKLKHDLYQQLGKHKYQSATLQNLALVDRHKYDEYFHVTPSGKVEVMTSVHVLNTLHGMLNFVGNRRN